MALNNILEKKCPTFIYIFYFNVKNPENEEQSNQNTQNKVNNKDENRNQ